MSQVQTAARLRAARKRSRLKLRDIAAVWGCSPSNVSRALSGEQAITTQQLLSFARLTGTSVNYLLGVDAERKAG